MTTSDDVAEELEANAARIVTVCPAANVDAGENKPAEVMNPVEEAPPVAPFTAQFTTVLGEPDTVAMYCALPPSLTDDGPVTVTVCASIMPEPKVASSATAYRGKVAMTPTLGLGE